MSEGPPVTIWAGAIRAGCCPPLAALSIGLAEGKEPEGCTADSQDLEKLTHFAGACTGQAIHVGKNRLLENAIPATSQG